MRSRFASIVERGGSIVATHETSLYDEWGVRRADFGLADLFGASYDGSVDARMQNSYLRWKDPATGKRHPLLRRSGRRRAHHQRRVARAYAAPPAVSAIRR